MGKNALSLVILARDEADTLARAVASARELISELVIGVDTASTDDTLAVAHSLDAKVIALDFERDFGRGGGFSGALNHLCSHASGDWILRLDGHEHIDPSGVPRLSGALERAASEDYRGIALRLRMSESEGGIEAMTIRLYRPGPGVQWIHPIHESIQGLGPSILALPSVVLRHERSSPAKRTREVQRQALDRRLLEAMLSSDPSEASTWAHLGRLAIDRGEGEEGRGMLLRAIELGSGKKSVFRARCHLDVGWSALGAGHHELAREHGHRALQVHWNIPEAHCLFADCALSEGDQARAWHHLLCARSIPHVPLELPVARRYHTWWPAQQMARIALSQGRLEVARSLFQEVDQHEATPEALSEARPWRTHSSPPAPMEEEEENP